MTQRLRVTFAKEGPLRWVAHLDLMRTWERAIRRAVLPLSYSQGFSPHAKIALAAPLPVGVEGHGELIDLWLEDALALDDVAKRLAAAMPPGLSITEVRQVSDDLPSMQSCLLAARYEVQFDTDDLDRDHLETALQRLLALDSLDWEEQRGKKTRKYDLRATILEAHVPLGSILTGCRFPFVSSPLGYFSVARADLPPKLSALATNPLPKWCFQIRLIITLAVSGLRSEAIHSAIRSRPLPWWTGG